MTPSIAAVIPLTRETRDVNLNCHKWEVFLEQKFLTGSMPLLASVTFLLHVVLPRLIDVPHFFMKCGVGLAQKGRIVVRCNPICGSSTQKVCNMQV